MIFTFLATVVLGFLELGLAAVHLPSMPDALDTALFTYIDYIFEHGSGIISFFLPMEIVRPGIPILIAIINMQHIYDGLMWVLKKIPGFSID